MLERVPSQLHAYCFYFGAWLFSRSLLLASDRSVPGHESKIPPGEEGRAVKETAKRGALSLSLQLRTERSFRKARPISFVAAKDEFDPLGSSICSKKKRETSQKQKKTAA